MRSCQQAETEYSAVLLAAQEKLQAIRRQLNIYPNADSAGLNRRAAPELKEASWLLRNGQQELRCRRELASINLAKEPAQSSFSPPPQIIEVEKTADTQLVEKPKTVAVYPSLLLAMLKQDQETAGRVYLLLRYLDTNGRGWFHIDEIRERLTRKESPLKVMGWRRLRQVFRQGESVFWERDSKGRLWLRSALKIALELDCHRLKGKRVDLPLKALLGGIGAVRAHFYASFHSGRRSDNPISRDTLEDITGLCPRTQRAYDRLAGVKRQQNIAVGPKHTEITAKEQYWQRGRAVFAFVDSQGQRGTKNRHYLAWQLPNSYQAPHRQRSKGRQKKINQQLAKLVNHGVQATDQSEVDKLFWPDGAAAGRAYSRDQELDAYWPRGRTQKRSGLLWHVFVGEAK